MLEQLAGIARVPSENRRDFYQGVDLLVFMMCRYAERHSYANGGNFKKSAKRIARAASELSRAMAEAGEGACDIIRLAVPKQSRPRSFDDYGDLIARLATAAKKSADSRDEKSRSCSARFLLRV